MFLLLLFLPVIIFFVLLAILKIVQRLTYSYVRYIEKDDLSDPKEVKELNLLQYNVFWRPFLLHMFKEEHVRERSILMPKFFQKYDVICLDESFHFGSDIAKNFIEAAKEAGFKYIVTSHHVPVFSRFVIDSGLMILSRYPITKTSSVTYSPGSSYDQFSAKGVLYARIQIGKNKHFHVFASHLQASYGTVKPNDIKVRQNQISELVQFVKSEVTDGQPITLCADFNVDSRSGQEYEKLEAGLEIPGYVRSDALFQTHNDHVVTFGEGVEKVLVDTHDGRTFQCIDYIFLFEKKGEELIEKQVTNVEKFKIEGKPYTQLSDHFAVHSKITFK